jgi:hypothetical protein
VTADAQVGSDAKKKIVEFDTYEPTKNMTPRAGDCRAKKAGFIFHRCSAFDRIRLEKLSRNSGWGRSNL